MQRKIIRSAEEIEVWVQERRLWDRDFWPMLPIGFPSMVVWAETESNGYQTMEYEFFSLDELTSIIEKMKESE